MPPPNCLAVLCESLGWPPLQGGQTGPYGHSAQLHHRAVDARRVERGEIGLRCLQVPVPQGGSRSAIRELWAIERVLGCEVPPSGARVLEPSIGHRRIPDRVIDVGRYPKWVLVQQAPKFGELLRNVLATTSVDDGGVAQQGDAVGAFEVFGQ